MVNSNNISILQCECIFYGIINRFMCFMCNFNVILKLEFITRNAFLPMLVPLACDIGGQYRMMWNDHRLEIDSLPTLFCVLTSTLAPCV